MSIFLKKIFVIVLLFSAALKLLLNMFNVVITNVKFITILFVFLTTYFLKLSNKVFTPYFYPYVKKNKVFTLFLKICTIIILSISENDENEDLILYEDVLIPIFLLFISILLSLIFWTHSSNEIDVLALVLNITTINILLILIQTTLNSFKDINNKYKISNWNLFNFIFPYLEIIGLFFKTINTSFRFYSNYIAGHLTLILIYIIFNFLLKKMFIKNLFLFFIVSNLFKTYLVLIIFYFFFILLELVLSIIQTYIYILLSFLFYIETN